MIIKNKDILKHVTQTVNSFTYTDDEKILIIEILGVIYNWMHERYCNVFNIDEFLNVKWIDVDDLCAMIDALYCICAFDTISLNGN